MLCERVFGKPVMSPGQASLRAEWNRLSSGESPVPQR